MRDKIHPPRAPERKGGGGERRERFQEDVGTWGGGGASERWQKRHKSDGHPKVPRNTKQKKDRARAGVATLERGSQSGRLFSNNLPRRRDDGRRGRRGPSGGGFPAAAMEEEEAEEAEEGIGGCTRGQRRLGAYCC